MTAPTETSTGASAATDSRRWLERLGNVGPGRDAAVAELFAVLREEIENERGAAAALARVLGIEQPELSCEECFAQLDRYVELCITGGGADREVPGMRAHLDGCPACAEDFDSLRDLAAADREAEG